MYLSCPMASPSSLVNRERQTLLVRGDAPLPGLCPAPLTTERKIPNLTLPEAGQWQETRCQVQLDALQYLTWLPAPAPWLPAGPMPCLPALGRYLEQPGCL